MDKEVEDILSNESSSSSSSYENINTQRPKSKLKTNQNTGLVNIEQARLSESSSSEAESLTGEYPRGLKRKHSPDNDGGIEGDDEEEVGGEGPRYGDALERFNRGELIPDDYEIEGASDDEDEEEDRVMAEQLEREFMEGEDSLSNSNF